MQMNSGEAVDTYSCLFDKKTDLHCMADYTIDHDITKVATEEIIVVIPNRKVLLTIL